MKFIHLNLYVGFNGLTVEIINALKFKIPLFFKIFIEDIDEELLDSTNVFYPHDALLITHGLS